MEEMKSVIVVLEMVNGEVYVGLIGDQKGNVYYLILLFGDDGEWNWKDLKEWVVFIGGDLLSCFEQVMLWVNCCSEFKCDWYWSNEFDGIGWVWFQYFINGDQVNNGQFIWLCV